MPFTVSHVAAVLPLRSRASWARALPAAPLAIGAMVPDLVTAVGLPGLRTVTHTWSAAVSADAVLALLLCAVWAGLLRPAVADVVPGLAARWQPPERRRRPDILRAGRWYLAAALGAVTHVLWDGATHVGTGLATWPWLVDQPGLFPVLQWISSAFGLLVLGVWAARWWRERTPVHPPAHTIRRGHALVALLVAAVSSGTIGALRYLARQAAPVAAAHEGSPIVEAAFGALSGLLLAAVLLSVVYRLASAARPA